MNNHSGDVVYLGGHAYSLNGYFLGENMYRAWVQNDRGETKLLHIYNFAKFQSQLPDAGKVLLTKFGQINMTFFHTLSVQVGCHTVRKWFQKRIAVI